MSSLAFRLPSLAKRDGDGLLLRLAVLHLGLDVGRNNLFAGTLLERHIRSYSPRS